MVEFINLHYLCTLVDFIFVLIICERNESERERVRKKVL